MLTKITTLKRVAASLRTIPFLPKEARETVDLIIDLLEDLVHAVQPAAPDKGAANSN